MCPVIPEKKGEKRHVALLMGSFNPVHIGHLAVARYVVSQLFVDEVWVVVSPQNPFKTPEELAPFENRLEMVRLALEQIGDERLKACNVEATLPQPSYTINTVRFLQEQYPDVQFTILAGSDIADQLPRWHESEKLRSMVRFLFYPRNNGVASTEIINAPTYCIDSTSLRAKIASGDFDSKDLLSESVVEYIRNENLYAAPSHTKQLIDTINEEPNSVETYFERGQAHYRNGDLGKAINDFNSALELDPNHTEAQQMKDMISGILNYRNTDIYNL